MEVWLRQRIGSHPRISPMAVTFALDSMIIKESPAWKARILKGELERLTGPGGEPWPGDPLDFCTPQPAKLPEKFIIETVRGYRSWASIDPAGWLHSGQFMFPWVPGGWTSAVCRRCATIPATYACQPDFGAGCGLYANWVPQQVQAIRWGVIEAKGRIITHQRGFRAEQARVIALGQNVCHGCRDGYDRHVKLAEYRIGMLQPSLEYEETPHDSGPCVEVAQQVARAAAVYGVPLLPYDAIVAEYPPQRSATGKELDT